MKPYFFRFVIASFAFLVGIGLVSFYLNANFLIQAQVSNKANDLPNKTSENNEGQTELTFKKISAGSAINIKTKEKISYMDFRSSDGKSIKVNHFYAGDSYKKESARFEVKLKKAKKVLEVTPILDEQGTEIGKRALFEENKEFKILKLFKVDRKEYFSSFEFYEIVAPTLIHLLAFENRKR